SIRAWLDPQKLAACNMTAIDVADAIRRQNLDAPAGQIGQPPSFAKQAFELPIHTLGRLTEPEQFGDIVGKAALSAPPPSPSGGRPPPRAGSGLPNLGAPAANGSPTTGGTTDSGTTGDSTATSST